MRLYVDLDLRQVVTALGVKQPAATLYFTRGDGAALDLQFTRDGAVIDPGCESVFFVIKPTGVFDGAALVLHTTFTKTGSGATAMWSGEPNFNNETLDAALGVGGATDVASLTANAEIGFVIAGKQTTTRAVRTIIENDLYRGSELSPSAFPIGSAATFYPTIKGLLAGEVAVVSGAGTASANGTLVQIGTYEGRPRYRAAAGEEADSYPRCHWADSRWNIVTFDDEQYFSISDVAYPWLATDWTVTVGQGASAPTPTVTQGPTLASIATTTVPVGVLVQVAVSGELQTWQLQAGTTAESVPGGIVRPNDYHASTNAKIWVRLA